VEDSSLVEDLGDNGGCPGTKGAGTCSGIIQPTWFFSHVFELFTR
jgi:hypothetical protein